MHMLLLMSSGSSAIIENNILTEDNVLSFAYYIVMNSSIQLSNVVFIRNRMAAQDVLWLRCFHPE